MTLFDDPRIGIPLVVGFVALVIYVNRCPNCGRWFSVISHDHLEMRHGKRVKVTTGYSCRRCGASASSRSGLWKGGRPVPEAVRGLPRWHPRVQWAIAPWRTAVVVLILLFIAGFVAFDPEVVLYPSHWQSYLEPYVEFLLDPLHGSRKVTRKVRVAGGRWKVTRTIEEGREVVREGWKALLPPEAVIVEAATRSWSPSLAREGLAYDPSPVWVKYRVLDWLPVGEQRLEGNDDQPQAPAVDLPAAGEGGAGVRRLGAVREEFTIDLAMEGSDATYTLDAVSMFAIADRRYQYRPLGRDLYRRLRNATGSWDAKVWWYSPRADPQITLWVEDPSRFPD